MRIETIPVGDFGNNAYLLSYGPDVVLVDAAAEPDVLLDRIAGRPVSSIVTTHRHHDHVGALAALAAQTDARLFAGAADSEAVAAAAGRAVVPLTDGDHVRVGSVDLEVITLAGHTPGGIALAYRPASAAAVLIVGDSLFPGGVGKTSSPFDFETLLDEVTSKLFERFSDDTAVLPGHGAPTTLGAERPHLEEWRVRGW